jgi:ferredoxin
MTLIPTIDQMACCGQADCLDLAPGAFAMDGNLAEVVGTDADERVLAAARACPTEAIAVHDAAGRQVYP